jgi:hypothetical protein
MKETYCSCDQGNYTDERTPAQDVVKTDHGDRHAKWSCDWVGSVQEKRRSIRQLRKVAI